MSAARERLLALLADGELHSGGALAARLGVTRTTVWNVVGELRALGVGIDSVDRRGYRLPRPVELLNAEAMRREAPAALPEDLDIVFETGSTNEDLAGARPPPAGRPRVLVAEIQTAGRGRRGRDWLAPFGSGLTFSIGWSYAETPADLPALTLALGVASARALHGLGAIDVRLKWPNDLVTHGKLGGLLTQLRHEAGGAAYVVVGLGLNVELPAGLSARVDAAGGLPPADLRSSLHAPVGRNALAATLVAGMLGALQRFGEEGFPPFIDDWRRADALLGREVRIQQGGLWSDGVARGVDRDGALLVEGASGLQRIHSGDVTVREGLRP